MNTPADNSATWAWMRPSLSDDGPGQQPVGARVHVADYYALRADDPAAREGHGAEWVTGEVEVLCQMTSKEDMRIRLLKTGAEYILLDPLMMPE